MTEEDDIDDLIRAVAAAPARNVAEPSVNPGARIGGFRVLAELGAGGMGVVYRAEDERLRREVALKVIAPASEPDAMARRRFLREARSAAAVNHPNVATIFEVGEDDGRIFIAMELVDGVPLRRKLGVEGPLAIEEALGIARQIARGLSRAHEKGIVHRDLKPDNIMVGELVKVLDFGLARVADASAIESASTATNEIAGTPGYMSPEQATGADVDVRTDVFAFGVVLYEMLAGEHPFRGDSGMAIVIAIARDPHVPLSDRRADVPLALERIVDRCLEKSPSARYANAKEILDELDAVGTTPMASSERKWTKHAPANGASRRSALAPLAFIVAFGALAFGAWRWSTQAPAPAPPLSKPSESSPPAVPSEPSRPAPPASVSAAATASSPPVVIAQKASAVSAVVSAPARPRATATPAMPSASARPPKPNPLDDQN